MKKPKIIDGYDLSGVTTLHGLSLQQYYDLLEYQEFRCPESTYEFHYDEKLKKFIDTRGEHQGSKWKSSKKAPPIDHCHKTGFIRGILSENANRLVDNWTETYGPKWTEPPELIDYVNNPPAYNIIGKVKFK